jgi:hypothetical protein
MLDKDRLVKFLNLTDSQHDAEALLAIRKSNELLHNDGVKWIDVVESTTQPENPPEPTRWAYHDPVAETEAIRQQWLQRNSRKRRAKVVAGLGLVLFVGATMIVGANASNTVRTSVRKFYDTTRADIHLMLRTTP